MKVLVTGATGFIGRHLTKCLRSEGRQVIEILGRDINDINRAMVEKPDIVYHLAGLYTGTRFNHVTNTEQMIASNIRFGALVLDSMAKYDVRKIINIGSSWQTCLPGNFYGATKQAFEDILTYYTRVQRLCAYTIRMTNVFGAGDTKLLPSKLLLAANTGTQFKMQDPKDKQINLIYIDDVVDALSQAGKELYYAPDTKDGYHTVLRVDQDEDISLLRLVYLFNKYSAAPVDVSWPTTSLIKQSGCNQKFIDLPRFPYWSPEISVEEGLKKWLMSATSSQLIAGRGI